MGYSPWGHTESDTTEHSTHTHIVNKINEIFFPGQILKVLGDLHINISQQKHDLVTTSVKHFFFPNSCFSMIILNYKLIL